MESHASVELGSRGSAHLAASGSGPDREPVYARIRPPERRGEVCPEEPKALRRGARAHHSGAGVVCGAARPGTGPVGSDGSITVAAGGAGGPGAHGGIELLRGGAG